MKTVVVIGILSLAFNVFAKATEKSIAGAVFNGWIQGEIVNTDSPMDLAISGTGFLPLQKSAHQILYTRNLSIRMDNDGDLVQNASNLKILHISDGSLKTIYVADKSHKQFKDQSGREATLTGFAINDAGEVEGIYSDGSVERIASLDLAIFQNQRQLKLVDKEKHLLTASKRTGEVSYVLPGTSGAGKIFAKSQEKLDEAYYRSNLD